MRPIRSRSDSASETSGATARRVGWDCPIAERRRVTNHVTSWANRTSPNPRQPQEYLEFIRLLETGESTRNPKVAGSNPAPATKKGPGNPCLFVTVQSGVLGLGERGEGVAAVVGVMSSCRYAKSERFCRRQVVAAEWARSAKRSPCLLLVPCDGGHGKLPIGGH